jgi:eukaryotic-like serine/threonine-protein kinase
MALTSRVWGAGKILVLLAALGATYLLSAFVAMRLTMHAREVTVPDLAGRSVNEASTALEDLGLTLKVDENRRVDAKVPAGAILQQDPGVGVRVRRPRSVHVWVSQGEAATLVPSLVGDTERSAAVRVQQAGLTLTATAEVRTHDYPPDAVIAQDPAPGTHAGTVALLVNRADRGVSYVMPDLIGVDGDRAAELLRTRGFRVAVVGKEPYPGAPAGIVIKQTPAGGFQVGPGEAIALEITR